MSERKNIAVSMIRENLDNIPYYPLPEPYSMHWYRPGDESAWLRIERLAERHFCIADDLFEREFGNKRDLLSERQCFICNSEGQEIGTATAWFANNYNGKVYGLVHWVAIIPEEQGKGLGKPLMSIICNRLKELGYERALLNTSTLRIPAINLYLRFGFVPEIKDDNDIFAWREVNIRVPKKLQI